MRRLHYSTWIVLTGLSMGVAERMAGAQQQTQDQPARPIPAYRSPLAVVTNSNDTQDSDTESQTLTPDTRPLAGVQDLSLGEAPLVHSYWQPHFDVTSTIDSNALNATGSSGWVTWTSLLGGIDLHRASGSNDLMVSYNGGGLISNDGRSANSVMQELKLSEKYAFRRLTMSILDQLNYSPVSFYGYGGLSGLSLPGGGAIGIQPGFSPGQPILTTNGELITNSFLTQVDASLTPRSSLTFAGGYSLLNYSSNGLLNFGDVIFQGGYNYQLTRQDTLAVFYRFSGYRYDNSNQSINDHSFQASYGRRLTGKLAFQVSGGPDVATLQLPLSGSSGSSGGGSAGGSSANSSAQVYWSLYTSLIYQLQRTRLALDYNHGLGGGVGVLAGAVSDSVMGSVSRPLTRTLVGGLNAGYVRSKGLNIGTSAPSSRTYDYWTGGAHLSHTLGRNVNLLLNYRVQYQTSNLPFCTGATCGTNVVVHLVSIGLSWHDHPIVF